MTKELEIQQKEPFMFTEDKYVNTANMKIVEYLDSPAVRSLATLSQLSYGRALELVRDFILPRKITDLEELRVKVVEFASFLEEKKLSGKTIQMYITRLKIFMKWAGCPVEYTYKLTNTEKKQFKKKQLQRWFTDEEIEKCLVYKFPHVPSLDKQLMLQVIVRLLIETGARVREISNAKQDDVKITDGIIWLYDSKTEPRPAFFSPTTKEMLRNLQTAPMFWEKETLFPTTNNIKYQIQRMLVDLGLKKDDKDGRGPHTFRHYIASHLFYSGEMRIEDLAFLLGDTVETVVQIYIHPTALILKDRVYKAMAWNTDRKREIRLLAEQIVDGMNDLHFNTLGPNRKDRTYKDRQIQAVLENLQAWREE